MFSSAWRMSIAFAKLSPQMAEVALRVESLCQESVDATRQNPELYVEFRPSEGER